MSKENRRIEVNYRALILCLALGALIWFSPHPAQIEANGWHLLAVFVATILGIIIKPIPMGGVAILGLTFLTATDTLTFQQAFSGFSDRSVWLVVIAFFIARGFSVTGLGTRIAYWFVALVGRRTLGLSYGLIGADLCLAPAIPSVTARSAGILMPILKGLAKTFGSHPHDPSAKKMGSYLTMTAYHGTVITSSMFLTAMAANPLVQKAAGSLGVQITWGTWALAAFVPGLCSLLAIPMILMWLYPPQIKETPDAVRFAKEKLNELGPVKTSEWMMLATFFLLLILWIGGRFIGIGATEAGLIGLSVLLLTGVLNWKELTREYEAWETFVWFAALVMMAGYLNTLGVTQYFAQQITALIGQMGWLAAFGCLALIYYYSHYFFASATAHVSSMYAAFLAVAIGLGAPPLAAALALGFISNLYGGLTHYGLSPAPLLYGAGYVHVTDWWRLGFLMSLVHFLIWGIVGGLWWKLIGLW